MRRITSQLFFCLLFSTCFLQTFGQTASQQPEVILSLANNKTVYRIGEPVYIVMTFKAEPGTFVVTDDITEYPDQLILNPNECLTFWKKKMENVFRNSDHTTSMTSLKDKPLELKFALNSLIRFDKPGRYTLQIITPRVKPPKVKDFFKVVEEKPLKLTTNRVSFEIKEMSETEETEEVERLSEMIDSQKDWRKRDVYVRELSYLTGDTATREKVRRFLLHGTSPGNYYHHLLEGLYLSPNKLPAIELLEAAFRDLNREESYYLIHTLTTLRFLAELKDEDFENLSYQEIYAKSSKRQEQIRNDYLEELVKTLPQRTGNNKLRAAMQIFTMLPKDDTTSTAYLSSRALLIDNFDNLNPYDQNRLLDSYWEKVKNSLTIASLEKILSREKPVQYLNNTVALKRLLELDKSRARPFVVKEICNPDSIVGVETVGVLNDKFLPEADKCLPAQLKGFAESKSNMGSVMFRLKSLIAARFASAKVYPQLMGIYKTSGDKLGRDAQASILGYFARHNDKEAMMLVEQRLRNMKELPISNFFGDLSRVNFTRGMKNILRKAFEGNAPYEAGSAAYYLSKYGGKDIRKLLEKRYTIWLRDWMPRRAEFNAAKPSQEILAQRMFQINLVTSLKDGKFWKLTEQEILALRQSCFSDQCRIYFPLK